MADEITSPVRPTVPELSLWRSATFATLEEAGEWLDYLERHGVHEQTLRTLGENQFVVYWR